MEDEGTVWPDRALVTDSQRLSYPVMWRKSAVMTAQWRLVNGRELYAIKEDPEQRQDVSAAHPDTVSELRLAYDSWWKKVSRQFDEDIPIAIGGPGAGQLRLNTHDWRNEDCECAWNQSLVRQGLNCNGHWEVEVVEGWPVYGFTLRQLARGGRGRYPGWSGRWRTEGVQGHRYPTRCGGPARTRAATAADSR